MTDGRNLLQMMDSDGDKPVALRAHSGIDSSYGGRGYLLTRDVQRIREICSAVNIPWACYERGDFPDGIEGLTIWTEDSVIDVFENYEGGTTLNQVRRSPPDEPDHGWSAA